MEAARIHEMAPTLNLFKIQRSCVYDGPGVRTTLFFRGCNLRCLWCQNPEGQSAADAPEPRSSVEEVMEVVLRDRQYYLASAGGVTLSGGEPLLNPAFARELLCRCKAEGIHTAVETCGAVPWSHLESILEYTDLFLYDIKLVDPAAHQEWTGTSNKAALANARALAERGARLYFSGICPPAGQSTNPAKETLTIHVQVGYTGSHIPCVI